MAYPGEVGVLVESLKHDAGEWQFTLLLSGVVNQETVTCRLKGECNFAQPELDWPTLVARTAAAEDAAAVVFEPPGKAQARRLLWAKILTGGFILVVGIVSSIGSLAVAVHIWSEELGATISLPDLLVLAAFVGASGSAAAAMRSFMDRTAGGVESDRDHASVRAQWPGTRDDVKKPERFSSNIVPGLIFRPLLGATLGPIGYATALVTSQLVVRATDNQSPNQQILVVVVTAGLAGMFAKSIWENLNSRAKNIFKPESTV